MAQLSIILLVCFALGLLVHATQAQIFVPPPTVDEFNVTRYLGRWYQAYANIIVLEGQNRGDPFCVTADYELCTEDSITLVNRQYLDWPGGIIGEEYNISGIAYFTEEVGKLDVYFPSVDAEGDYWIMKLGPETFEDELYQYSLVSDAIRAFVYVLARDVDYFNENYYDEVFEWLEDNGFNTTLTELLPTYQGDLCYYPDPREPDLPDSIVCNDFIRF